MVVSFFGKKDDCQCLDSSEGSPYKLRELRVVRQQLKIEESKGGTRYSNRWLT